MAQVTSDIEKQLNNEYSVSYPNDALEAIEADMETPILDESSPKKNKRRNIGLIVASSLLAVCIAIGIYCYFFGNPKSKRIIVPIVPRNRDTSECPTLITKFEENYTSDLEYAKLTTEVEKYSYIALDKLERVGQVLFNDERKKLIKIMLNCVSLEQINKIEDPSILYRIASNTDFEVFQYYFELNPDHTFSKSIGDNDVDHCVFSPGKDKEADYIFGLGIDLTHKGYEKYYDYIIKDFLTTKEKEKYAFVGVSLKKYNFDISKYEKEIEEEKKLKEKK